MIAIDSSQLTDRRVSRLFMALGVLFVSCLLVSNILAGKLIAVGGFVLQAADLLFPLTYIFGDIFTEVYGFRNSRLVIWTGFACCFFATCVYQLAIVLPHPDFWQGQEAYRTVFATTPRIFAASLVAYLIGEYSNSVILSRMKVMTGGRFLWTRTIFSTVVGEGADTLIFNVAAFLGAMPTRALFGMIAAQYVLKLVYEILLTPVTYRVVAWLKRKEGVDVYDRGIRYTLV